MSLTSTKKPYLQFIGGNAIGVTGSCTILRWKQMKYAIDMGMIQTNNILADYRANKDLVKRIKPKTIHAVIITHLHSDHISNLLPAVAQGMNAHIYIPEGSSTLMRIMLEDSAKIMESDALLLAKKHGVKVPPLATLQDVEKVMNRCIEIPFGIPTEITGGAILTFYHAGHIVCSAQCLIKLKDGYTIRRVGFTGDIGYEKKSVSVPPIETMPFADIIVGEATYCEESRSYSYKKDRWYDEQLITTAINQYNRILCPVFSLQRLEDVLECLRHLKITKPIYVDAPLGIKLYQNWPEKLDYQETMNVKFVEEWSQSQALQVSKESCVILSSSGMLSAGRALSHLKYILPDSHNCVLFCGYSADNTLATIIKNGARDIKVNGEMISNNCQIYSLNTFSSHANYHQLVDYYTNQLRFNKLCLVHADFEGKVEFAHELQDQLANQGKSSRVVAVNQDSKIYF